MLVEIRNKSFDPWQELSQYESRHLKLKQSGQYGATGVFVGTMRDFNEGSDVSGMFLDYYPGMTEKKIESICQQALIVDDVIDTLVIHRVGDVLPDDAIVLVAVWSGHRKSAFEQSRLIMEELKSNVPFWKKEALNDGSTRWVSKNTPGF